LGRISSSPFDWRGAFDGASKTLPNVGVILSGSFKASGDRDDANAAGLEAHAQAELRAYGEAHDDAQAADGAIEKVTQLLDQIEQITNATRLAAASGRA
jgi:hypothetical protein